ncbi:MAG TPA: L-threonylcarbamoyladenylate synthase [Candidatus Saccharimonadales bacterium]|nr:L-threonylcarbamoyladenylate synthase [Candidatus Saccharimonadales bacterium]
MPDRLAANATGIAMAANLLRGGALVAFPTDTVYGIGCRADDPQATERLFAAKRRAPDKAIPWLIGSLDEAVALGFIADGKVRDAAARFWPGGLTIVLPGVDGEPGQAFRIPDHPVPLALVAAVGPLATSSANRSGEPETLDADEVAIAFADSDEPAATIDGGPVPGGLASSVLDMTGERPRLVREGALSRSELEAVIGPID